MVAAVWIILYGPGMEWLILLPSCKLQTSAELCRVYVREAQQAFLFLGCVAQARKWLPFFKAPTIQCVFPQNGSHFWDSATWSRNEETCSASFTQA